MKSKTKFLWIYTIILFSVALVLILFAGLTQQNYEEELESHETAKVGLQKSAADLSQTNLILNEKNSQLEKENEQLKEKQSDFEEISKTNDINTALIEALEQFEKGNKEDAEKRLDGIDHTTLNESQLNIYGKIIKILPSTDGDGNTKSE